MTKTEILTDITTKLADESDIIAEELREVVEGIVNYLVPDVIDITPETPSTIIQFKTGTQGYVYISKVGRLVTMYGSLKNISGSLGQVGFTIIDEDYEPGLNLVIPVYGNGVYVESGVAKPTAVLIVYDLYDYLLAPITSIPSGVTVTFSITYLTNS